MNDAEPKYGFFCDIEEETKVIYYLIRKSDSYEIKCTQPSSVPTHASPHPSYSHLPSEQWFIEIKEDTNEDKPYPKRHMFCSFRIKHRLKKYFYSCLVCSAFVVSLYITLSFPIG